MGVFLSILLLISASNIVAKAEDDIGELEQIKMEQQEEAINKLFDEMNKLILQKIMVSDQENIASINDIQEELEKIDDELEELGVRKIDINNPQDKAMLDEMPALPINEIEIQSGVYDDAPTLSAIADYYYIYIYDGEYTCNSGTTYPHRKIYVHDKTGGALQQLNECDLIAKKTTLKDLLEYNFQYATSQLLALLPYGTVLDWTLGNIFTILKSYDPNTVVTVASDNKIYKAVIGTSTEMYYYYVYDGSWKLIGNAATVWVSRSDIFWAYINGSLVKESKDAETWNCSSGQAYWKYIELYDVTGKNNNYFMLNFPLGSFDVNGLNRTYTIKPLFYEYPGEIVLGKPGQ